jgi:phosphoglycolate phosphatase
MAGSVLEPEEGRWLEGWTIAFDLDGTLVDTAPDLVRVTNVIMQELGLATVPLERLRSLIGQGAATLLSEAASESGVVFDAETLAAHRARFIALYAEQPFSISRVFNGLVACLQAFRAAGATLSVCTNKPRDLSIKVLEGLELSDWFSIMVCAEDTDAIKPDPAHLTAAVVRAGGDMSRSLLIGDSEIDFNAARNAGVPVVLASFGYSKTKASALGADAVFDHYDQLPDLIRAITRRDHSGGA